MRRRIDLPTFRAGGSPKTLARIRDPVHGSQRVKPADRSRRAGSPARVSPGARTGRPRGSARGIVLAVLLASSACVPGPDAAGSDGPTLGRVLDLPSPAAPGSGEPHLAAAPVGSTPGDVVLSWLEPVDDGSHALRLAFHDGAEGWTSARTVARSDRFFVNWADFPSVLPLDDGTLAAHWLVRGGKGTYDYGIRIALSADGGRSWSGPVIPHRDGTPQEHGFVTLLPEPGGGFTATWLDGRRYAYAGEAGREGVDREMTLRHAPLSARGEPGPERLLDGRVCDCCQTDGARTPGGLVIVYRDRSPEEIRDIVAIRRTPAGWSDPAPVHRDGWEIAACPVNGPAVDAAGRSVAVAWFTAAGDTPRVRLSFSGDGARSFGAPVEIDEGDPAGRVDVVLLDGRNAVVSWLERTGGGGAEVRARVVSADGRLGPSTVVGRSRGSRASGFPRMVARGSDLYFAWTEPGSPSRIRVARAPVREGGATP